MKNRIMACVVLLLAFCGRTMAQPVQVTVKTDARQIMVGDQLRYFIEATADTTDARLQWANIPDTFHSLELVERGRIDTLRQGSKVQYKQRLMITGFDSGSFIIPSFAFIARKADGSNDTVRTDSVRILVQTVPVDTTQAFKGIKTIAEVKISWKDYIGYIIAGLVVLIALVVLVVYLVKRKGRKPEVQVPEVKETDQQRALRLLDELAAQQLWEQGRIKEYYTELTDIVRSYIEDRFQTPALELTSDELLKKAKKNRDMVPFVASLRSLLHMADLAKFAKANHTAQDHIDAIDKAKEFIVISTPKITVVPPSKPNNA